MSKPGLSFGISLSKKPGTSKPAPPRRKAFGGDDDSDDEAPKAGNKFESLDELGGFDAPASSDSRTESGRKTKSKNAPPPAHPPGGKAKKQQQESAMFGDLSSSLSSRKHAEAAEELDASVYDYDGVYESFKPQKKATAEDVERKPKYMSSLLAAASVRKRDALIAEEKKIAREREAEGEAYADKEKFVTEAYKKQQEENRRIEEEEKRREEEEAKKNKTGGMNAFYKDLLNKGEERHAEVLKAAEEKGKSGPVAEEAEETKDKSEAELAKEINEKGGSVAVNEDGLIVDKRQLLRGGLNVGAKKEAQVKKDAERPRESRPDQGPRSGFIGSGGKGAMRERQTRMMEAQLEAALKRTREEEEAENEKVERAAKTRKTDGEISSAKERYLARKRAAEEAKKMGLAE
ncbi:Nuclear speckle splicing regulatory protein 1-like protein [Colletotrichum orbiculare MAFF 240422]|uniref:Nuclear speckle splicing regulatory protein 1-like protein n=2 Tax=Colletotrichum orbiculare species complex TaxID=2707354 RepID=A0A484FZT2_COLOR|nr:Nuclear speckle splicing regulatory protein 1-like protein [Colletotrichum orbiculare MAFF 240422]TDZ36287.1 Nuclear speckle splicing regulatory protein 1-like protein [Colletotrichum spinosum]